MAAEATLLPGLYDIMTLSLGVWGRFRKHWQNWGRGTRGTGVLYTLCSPSPDRSLSASLCA